MKDLFDDGFALWIIYGKEIAPKTGTPHLQGFIYMRHPQTIKGMVRKCSGPHYEVAYGDDFAQIKYTTKDGSVTEHGTKPQQGKRNDIEKVKQMVKEHKTMNEIVFEADSYQAARMAELLMKYQKAPIREKPYVEWIIGRSGSGKTRRAIRIAGEDYWISSDNLQWWDGYYGQKSVILDDFRGDMCKFNYLLRLLDRYPVRVQTKGSSQWLNADKIIITSDRHPKQIFRDCGENLKQLTRRIDLIFTMDEEEPEWPDEDIISSAQEWKPENLKCTQVLAQKSGVILGPDFYLAPKINPEKQEIKIKKSKYRVQIRKYRRRK